MKPYGWSGSKGRAPRKKEKTLKEVLKAIENLDGVAARNKEDKFMSNEKPTISTTYAIKLEKIGVFK